MFIEQGGNLSFKVNSISNYNNELEYTNWTTLEIYSDTTWYLGVSLERDSFRCNFPEPALSVDIFSLQASDGGESGHEAFDGTELTTSEITFSAGDGIKTLVSAADSGYYKINITYYLDPLLGKHPAYYNQNLLLFDAITRSSYW
jgi:hypothetical protein